MENFQADLNYKLGVLFTFYSDEKLSKHTFLHSDAFEIAKAFRYDAHPMAIMISTMSSVSSYHPEANPLISGQHIYSDPKLLNKQIYRVLGIMPTIAAEAYRHTKGNCVNKPMNHLNYVEVKLLFRIE